MVVSGCSFRAYYSRKPSQDGDLHSIEFPASPRLQANFAGQNREDAQRSSCSTGSSDMAAGTEVTQPVNGAYSGLPLDTHCSRKERLTAGDSSKCSSDVEQSQRETLGRPPRPVSAVVRHCINATGTAGPSEMIEIGMRDPFVSEPGESDYKPVIRSGCWSDIGCRRDMEDEHVRIDDLVGHLGYAMAGEGTGAYYGVFDGHGGREAAQFVKENMLKFIVEDVSFPTAVGDAVRRAFLQTDMAFAEAYSTDQSGTTAIAVLIFGRSLLVANAGDCRAVLCRRGKAVEMSRDHKPGCAFERSRIEALGGFVIDGYLNGQLSVARALGDWHMKELKGSGCLLSAEPELKQIRLSEEDEFMIIGCDGLWDVFTSQNAIDFARRKLQQHNDPEQCSRELVTEALRRDTCDNLTVMTVCFQLDPPPRLYTAFKVRRSVSVDALRNLQDLLDCGT
eukprot:c28325_g2_i2 orf=270-1616(+)